MFVQDITILVLRHLDFSLCYNTIDIGFDGGKYGWEGTRESA